MPDIRECQTGRKLIFKSKTAEGSANSTYISRSKLTNRMLYFKGKGFRPYLSVGESGYAVQKDLKYGKTGYKPEVGVHCYFDDSFIYHIAGYSPDGNNWYANIYKYNKISGVLLAQRNIYFGKDVYIHHSESENYLFFTVKGTTHLSGYIHKFWRLSKVNLTIEIEKDINWLWLDLYIHSGFAYYKGSADSSFYYCIAEKRVSGFPKYLTKFDFSGTPIIEGASMGTEFYYVVCNSFNLFLIPYSGDEILKYDKNLNYISTYSPIAGLYSKCGEVDDEFLYLYYRKPYNVYFYCKIKLDTFEVIKTVSAPNRKICGFCNNRISWS